MAQCSNSTGIGKDQLLFAVAETTPGGGGTITGSDVVYVTGDGSFTQSANLVDDAQKKGTLSKYAKVFIKYDPGEYSFPCYIKPAGSLGVAPRPAQFLKADFGTEAISVGVSVIYTLDGIDDCPNTLLIVFKHSHIVFWNYGCSVNGEYRINANEPGDATFSGNILKQKFAGVSTVNNGAGYPITTTAIVVDDAKKFTDEVRIKFTNLAAETVEDDGGVGYLISSIDYGTDTITISSGLAGAIVDGDEVSGWLPVPSDAGVIVSGRLGDATFDAVAVDIVDATISVNNNVSIVEDEKSGSNYPEKMFKAEDREVPITYDMIFTKDGLPHWYDAENQTQTATNIAAGATAGSRYRFEMPAVVIETPTLSGDASVAESITGMAIATAADNEISLVFD